LENWLEVERLVSRPHFEANAGRPVAIEDQPAAAQHTRPKIDRRAVENDDLYRSLQATLEIGFQIERPSVERGRRGTPVQDAEIDVTVRTGHVARDTAKKIHGPDTAVSRVEKAAHTLFNVGSLHTSIIPWQLQRPREGIEWLPSRPAAIA
jgi:hypothetical protein